MISIIGALVATLFVEIPLAYILGYTSKKAIFSVVAVNILTNPILNLFILVNSLSYSLDFKTLVLILEVVVVLAEWKLLIYLLKDSYPRKKFLQDVIVLNLVSCLIGLLLIF